MSESIETPLPRCGLVRRLMAILYDSLLLAAVLLFAAALATLVLPEELSGLLKLTYQFYMLAVAFLFFYWFWSHGGQTLGMVAWRIKVVSSRPGPPTASQLLLRFLMAIVSWLALGAGYWWSLFDKDKLTWHDRFSMTELVVLPKKDKR